MITISYLSAAAQSAFMILIFLALVFQFFVCCMGYFYRAKWYNCKILAILDILAVMLLSFMASGVRSQAFGEPAWKITRKIMELPAAAVFLLITLTTGYGCWILWHQWKYRKSAVTRASVREGANLMPMGLCFFKEDGQLILTNIKMEELSHLLCGETLQNGRHFWQMISQGKLKSGAKRSSVPDAHTIILPEGAVWVFNRQVISMNDEEIVQVTAMDATEIYKLTGRLKQETSMMQGMNARLKLYSWNVEKLTRTNQRLAAKIQIHDSIGRNLMMTRYYLAMGMQQSLVPDLDMILNKWQHTISLLRYEKEPDELQETFKYLTDAASYAGVEIVLHGEIPRESRLAELVTAAGAEALTNAVRHAGARQLTVKVFLNESNCCAVFTNDGLPPEKPLQEGGGLTGLRSRIEGEGGTVTISADPEFTLMITIPRERRMNPA